MIKIETKVIAHEEDAYSIGMAYEVSEDVQEGEYLAILDKIKNEVLEQTSIDEDKLIEILFKETRNDK